MYAAEQMQRLVPHGGEGARETEPNGNVRVVRKKIKHTYLRVYPDGEVVVTAPRGTPDSAIERLLNDRADWIRAHVAAARERRTERLKLTAGERVYLFGEALALAFESHPGRSTVVRETDRLLLRLPGGEGADYEVRRALLLRYYARALSARVEERLPALTAAVGKAASRVSIRLMRSRWGSCTPATGAIRLNLTLAWYPPECLDLVLAHELTHLWVAGHGTAFYRRLDSAYPARRETERVRKAFPACPFEELFSADNR